MRACLLALAVAAALPAMACANTTAATTTTIIQTSISLDPTAFLGAVSCSTLPGGMRSYVATVTDEGADGTPSTFFFTLPSSQATACTEQVNFYYVNPGDTYTAQIDGYTQTPDELWPQGVEPRPDAGQLVAVDPSSGSRHMLDPVTLQPVTPRWTTSCGGSHPTCDANQTCAVAAPEATVFVSGCKPLVDTLSPGPVTIEVDPNAALGSTVFCAADGGKVASFEILPDDPAVPVPPSVPCGGPPVAFAAIDGRGYGFSLDAKDANDQPVASATCSVVARKGVTRTALCDLLTPDGAMLIRLAPLLAQANLKCPGDVASYTVSVPATSTPDGRPLDAGPFPCTADARIAPLLASSTLAVAHLQGLDANGQQVAKLTETCKALIGPGEVDDAFCAPGP